MIDAPLSKVLAVVSIIFFATGLSSISLSSYTKRNSYPKALFKSSPAGFGFGRSYLPTSYEGFSSSKGIPSTRDLN